MKPVHISVNYLSYGSDEELDVNDRELVLEARRFTEKAYAPYSHFHVAAVARLANGEIVKGTNQENSSYPVGICAERSLMAAAATLYPDIPIVTMAIAYKGENNQNNSPVAPCGMCRQALLEFETRTQHTIRLLLTGQTGTILLIPESNSLLPLSFNKDNLIQF